jgi:hypothetical protein
VEISGKVALGTCYSRGIAHRGAPVTVQYRSVREAAQETLKSYLCPGRGDAIQSQRAVGRASPYLSRSHLRWRLCPRMPPISLLPSSLT